MALGVSPIVKSFAALVGDFAAGAQAASQILLDFAIGSVFRALAEAMAGTALWLQKLFLFALSVSRLQTSYGVWVDSFLAQFSLTRLAAVASTTQLTFSRFTATNPAVIPINDASGNPLQYATQDGTQIFNLYADASNPAYSPTAAPGGLPGYVIGAGVTSIDAPVINTVPGSSGNILAGAISVMRNGISGVDAVTNQNPAINGLDAESDDAAKARFILFINQLAKGTISAIEFAVLNMRQGMQVVVHNNVDPNGATDYGMITTYIDDGSGAPSVSLVAQAAQAIDLVKAAGTRSGVYAASTLTANIAMTIATAAGYSHSTVVGLVQTALSNFITLLGLESQLNWSVLEHVAYGIPGVTNVTGVLLNGATADLIPGFGQTIKPGTVAVS